ncbi:MAG: hypothetical protein JW729_05805, partial [Bacteroidales bacterium]|nr:hypothetical protein [Bacteroidales bacterium]
MIINRVGIMLYRNLFIALFVTGSLAYTSQASFAQTLNEEQVTVIAPYSPTITKAQKIGDVPTNRVNTNSKFKLEYYTNPQLISTTFELKELQAARYISSKDPKYKQNMIYVGMGLYTSPYAELFLNGKIKKDLTLGVHATHFSSKASVKDFAYSGFSKSGAEIWAKKTGAKKVFWFSGFYQRDLFHYYGFKPNDFLSNFVTAPDFDEESKQLFTDFGGKFNLSSTISKKKSGFIVDGGYRYFTDLYKNNENVINLDATYTRPIDFLGYKNQYGGIRLLSEVAISHWADYTQLQNVNLINITAPILTQNFFHGKVDFQLYYNLLFDRFDLKVGGVVSAGLDSTSTFRVYPDMNLKADLIKNVLDLFLQFDGGLVSPTYYSLSRENPYISAFLPLNYSSINYRFKGGFNINIVGRADIQLYGSFEQIDNDLFFTTDTVGFYRNQLNLIYDDAEVVKIGGDISVTVS